MNFQQLSKYATRQNCNNAGYTLIEVLIAMAIFSIGILGIAKMQIVSINGNNIAGKYTEGSVAGTSEIEKIINTAYDDASIANGTDGTVTTGIYTVTWTITDSVPISNVKRINMVVTWTIKGQAKSFTTTYYKAITI